MNLAAISRALLVVTTLAGALIFSACESRHPDDPDPAPIPGVANPGPVLAYLDAHYKSIPLIAENDRLRFFVSITINGKPGRLLVDSGAVTSVLFSKSLHKFDFETPQKSALRFSGIGGATEASSAPYQSFLISDAISVEPGRFLIINTTSEEDFDGCLGADLLAALRAVIDFKTDRIRFLDPGTKISRTLTEIAERAGMRSVTLQKSMNRPYLPVRIAGYQYRCLVDTGAPFLLLTPDAMEETGAENIILPTQARGISGKGVEQRLVKLPRRIVLGDQLILERCLVTAAKQRGGVPFFDYAGLVGVSMLADNAALLDLDAGRIHFESQNLRARFPFPEDPPAPETPQK